MSEGKHGRRLLKSYCNCILCGSSDIFPVPVVVCSCSRCVVEQWKPLHTSLCSVKEQDVLGSFPVLRRTGGTFYLDNAAKFTFCGHFAGNPICNFNWEPPNIPLMDSTLLIANISPARRKGSGGFLTQGQEGK